MSDFGLVQITRQRIRQNIMQAMKDACPVCGGSGFITKESHLVYDIEDWLKKFRRYSREFSLIIKCHPSDASRLQDKKFTRIQFKYLVRLRIEEDSTIPMGKFRFFSKKKGIDLTEKFK